ncbi:MAG: helix-turn-helix domain-containing protein [Clostridiales bacterium]|nr:helix-turn-helix domain-containing protein [Clostridiales bacterium]
MKHFTALKDAYSLCEAIGSPVRMDILAQILEHRAVTLSDLAKDLHLSNGALTPHIKRLESVGLIRVTDTPGKRGTAKVCTMAVDKILIDVASFLPEKTQSFMLPVGQYRSAQTARRCALIGARGFIGEADDPRYFTYPEHADCLGLWLTDGELTYTLPTVQSAGTVISEIRFHFEISALASRGETLPGQISFFIDDVPLGSATLPDENHDRSGALNPDWYDNVFPQYGSMKTLSVNARGSFWDGIKISEVTLARLHGLKTFTLSSHAGFALFGKSLGDYAVEIGYTIEYDRE